MAGAQTGFLAALEQVVRDSLPGIAEVTASKPSRSELVIDVRLVWYAWAFGGLYHWAVRRKLERLIGRAAEARGRRARINVRWW